MYVCYSPLRWNTYVEYNEMIDRGDCMKKVGHYYFNCDVDLFSANMALLCREIKINAFRNQIER